MDELEIKIVLNYKVSENGLTLNGILRCLEQDKDLLMRSVVKVILSALEEKAIEEYKIKEPGRYLSYGRRQRGRKLLTSFGAIRYRLAQIYDSKKATVFCPLLRKLAVIPYEQYQRESLEVAIGQVIHLSYRLGANEVRRIKGHAPSKSTLYMYIKDLAQSHGKRPSFKHRPFKFLMVDGTKVKRQGKRGTFLGKAVIRWALASKDVGRFYEPVGFWVAKDWSTIRKDLEKRLDYGKLEVLFSDGGPGIEDNLLSEGMRQQRCVWHGKRDFTYILFQDGLEKDEQQPFL